MTKDDCIFCKIAAGEIPSGALYEDDDFKVIFDRGPATKGHALILPKQHYANIFEIDDEVLAKATALAKKVATKMKEVLNCDGVNIVQNNGAAAGQTVFHLHIHLIPRYENDDAKFGWKVHDITDEEIAELVKTFE